MGEGAWHGGGRCRQQTSSNIYDNNFLNALFLPLSSGSRRGIRPEDQEDQGPKIQASKVPRKLYNDRLDPWLFRVQHFDVELNYFCASWNFNWQRKEEGARRDGTCAAICNALAGNGNARCHFSMPPSRTHTHTHTHTQTVQMGKREWEGGIEGKRERGSGAYKWGVE